MNQRHHSGAETSYDSGHENDQYTGKFYLMLLNPRRFSFLSAAVLLFTSLSSQAEITASIGATTEYVRDGISETRGQPALQGGVTWLSNTGLYAGIWSSGVERKEDHATYEHDAFAGYYLPLTDRIAADLSVTRYTWAGDTDIRDQSYTEGAVRLLINDALTFGWRQSGDHLGSGFDMRHLELGYTWQFSDFSLELFTAQHRWLEVDDDDFNFDEDTQRDSYWQFRVALDRSYGPWDIRIALNRTNLSADYDASTAIEFGFQRYFQLW